MQNLFRQQTIGKRSSPCGSQGKDDRWINRLKPAGLNISAWRQQVQDVKSLYIPTPIEKPAAEKVQTPTWSDTEATGATLPQSLRKPKAK
jgi:hypothetical protein